MVAYGDLTWVEAGSVRDAAAETARFAALQEAAVRRAHEAAGAPWTGDVDRARAAASVDGG